MPCFCLAEIEITFISSGNRGDCSAADDKSALFSTMMICLSLQCGSIFSDSVAYSVAAVVLSITQSTISAWASFLKL